jgi:geranylgeranyl diphosphate synthase type I
MELSDLFTQYLPKIETEMRVALDATPLKDYPLLEEQVNYHLAWGVPTASGKRIRPVLLLLTVESLGGDWQIALPAAAGVELLHNFSLIHDDIEDGSETRRGRRTVWSVWGLEHGINCGDAMFAAALFSMSRLRNAYGDEITADCMQYLLRSSIQLTGGQQMDMSFEHTPEVTSDQYIKMVTGKTAALIQSCAMIGGRIANADHKAITTLSNFGLHLGLAFQVIDDILGIWGKSDIIGKSVKSDLVRGKRTLPIIYGLQHIPEFHHLFTMRQSDDRSLVRMIELLEKNGAREYAEHLAAEWSTAAQSDLEQAIPNPSPARDLLYDLVVMLLSRDK